MTNSKQFLLLLLVLSASAAMSSAAAATSSLLEDEKNLLPLGFLNPDAITDCWSSILRVDGCAKDVLASFRSLQGQIRSECCSAIEDVGESCLLNIFSNPPFNPFFPPLLKAFCKPPPAPSPPEHEIILH